MVVNFRPELSGISKIIDSLSPILHASDGMIKVFQEKLMVAYRRPRNIQDELVRSKVRRLGNDNTGMRKCGKVRCQICKYVKDGYEFKKVNESFI